MGYTGASEGSGPESLNPEILVFTWFVRCLWQSILLNWGSWGRDAAGYHYIVQTPYRSRRSLQSYLWLVAFVYNPAPECEIHSKLMAR